MKKTVKFLSGTALVAAIAFVSLTSFNTPDPVVEDCGCPGGGDWVKTDKVSPKLQELDLNEDGFLCKKRLPKNAREHGAKGNTPKDNWPGNNFRDNNNCSGGNGSEE